MIPVSTLYDEYINRPKLYEQKHPFEYIVPPLQEGSEQQVLISKQNKQSKPCELEIMSLDQIVANK